MFPANGLGFRFENTKTNAFFFISSREINYLTPDPIVLIFQIIKLIQNFQTFILFSVNITSPIF